MVKIHKSVVLVAVALLMLLQLISGVNAQPSDWAKEYVRISHEEGITDSSTNYDYSEPISRQDFCELIFNYISALGVDSAQPTASFNDTQNTKILSLYAMGIINGKGDGIFAPDDMLTRQEAAVVLHRAINVTGPLYANLLYHVFNDSREIADWASDSVQFMCNLGIMNGVGDGKFLPNGQLTTEQAITAVVRVLNAQRQNTEDKPYDIINGESSTPVFVEKSEISEFYINEAIRLITESANNAKDSEYISLFTNDKTIIDELCELSSHDYSSPKEIYLIKFDTQKLFEKIDEDPSQAPLKKLITSNKTGFAALTSFINSTHGAKNLAAMSIMTNSRGYVQPSDFIGDFALYLDYPGTHSAIVSFSRYGDGVISANMSFAKNGDKITVFTLMQQLAKGFGENIVTFKRIK